MHSISLLRSLCRRCTLTDVYTSRLDNYTNTHGGIVIIYIIIKHILYLSLRRHQILKRDPYQSPRCHVKLDGAPTGLTYISRDQQPLQYSLYACFNLFFQNLQNGTKGLTAGPGAIVPKWAQNWGCNLHPVFLNFGARVN
jgi:hypothetical protein